MLLKVFAVYDSKLAAHFTPFFQAHPEMARRAFSATANDPQSQIHDHPQDFTLMELAEWNDESGEFHTYSKPINHGLAAAYKVRKGNGHGQEPQKPQRHEAHVRAGAEGGDPAQ